jgi:hypothetical protein
MKNTVLYIVYCIVHTEKASSIIRSRYQSAEAEFLVWLGLPSFLVDKTTLMGV